MRHAKRLRQKAQPQNQTFQGILKAPEIITWRAIMEAQKAVLSILESNLQKEGSTVSRFQILFYLYFEGPMAPSVIANRMVVTRGNITAFFKRLVVDKLIKAVSGKSESRPKYALTDKGKKEFERVFPAHTARVQKLVIPLDPKAVEQLKRIKQNAEDRAKTMR